MRKRKKIKDPFAEREASKYSNPIPSREFILAYLKKHKKPLKLTELIDALDLQASDERVGLRRRLRAMERDGQISFRRRLGYSISDQEGFIEGRVSGHKEGFGFVIPEDGSDDLFLNARQMLSVFDGDKVRVKIMGRDHRGRREAALVEVLERNTNQIVGRLSIEKGVTYVKSDNKRIHQNVLVPAGQEGSAVPGQMVVVEIVSQPTVTSQALGRVAEVLGDHMAPGMEIDVSIRSYELPHVWPDKLLKDVNRIKPEISELELEGRTDCRHLPFVTIDGEDAQDFDDAVCCIKRANSGWQLFVAIADVSHYVKPETALDKEALQRGNSVYFPGKVIPMLPEMLSNHLCSLKPEVDRLCMLCEMNISNEGKLTRYRFHQGVIKSQARLTYNQVAALIDGKNNEIPEPFQKEKKCLVPHLFELFELYKALRKSREARGAIDFETVETRVVFAENRKIEQIVPVKRNEAHRLIEECMLVANVATARYLSKAKIPTLFRVHAPPTAEKIIDLRKFLAELKLTLDGGKEPSPLHYATLLRSIAMRPDAHLIQTVLLRSLSQAVYSCANDGHFGLAYDAYTHFTSPIRRYPDLLVHRAIRHLLSGGKASQFFYSEKMIQQFGEHCSFTERRADEATRDTLDWLKCEFMQDRVGNSFDGVINAVTGFGLFIELKDIYVEGLLHVTFLKNDYYRFDPLRHRLTGERTGKSYHLGDPIKVRLVRVDLDNRKIDFELA